MDRIENSVHLGYLHRPTCTLFFLCFITFPSVVCFRCRKRPLYRCERGKVFGLNTLHRRKIQPETACPLDLFTFRRVCTNLMYSNGNKRLAV